MDPRKLLYLAAAIEHGSFKKAAKHLGISQPALSTSIDRFEKNLGERLLERSPNGVTPTPLGELLHFHARLIREELESAEQRLHNSEGRNGDVITFGVLPSLATAIIPAAVCQWRKNNKKTLLRIVEKNQLSLLLSLLRGELDFIIAQTEFYGFLEGMRMRVLFRDRLHIFGRSGHPAQTMEFPTWSDLAKFPWVTQMLGTHRTVLDKLMAAAHVNLPAETTECGSATCIKTLIIGSDSLAMLPASAVAEEVRKGELAAINISDPLLKRDIAVMFRDGVILTEADRALLAEIEAVGSRWSQMMNPSQTPT